MQQEVRLWVVPGKRGRRRRHKKVKGKKVKLTLEQGMKAQRESRDIVLLFL
jgi:hypothetical protein